MRQAAAARTQEGGGEVTHYREFYDTDWVGVWDLPGGRDRVVTIVEVTQGRVGGQGGRKKDRSAVMQLRELDRPMVLNKTNGSTIAGMYGAHVEQWPGKRIQLFGSTTDFGSKKNIPCIRIRPEIPKGGPTSGPRSSPVDPDAREAQKRAAGEWKDGTALRSATTPNELLDAIGREAEYIDQADPKIWAWVTKRAADLDLDPIQAEATLQEAIEAIREAGA